MTPGLKLRDRIVTKREQDIARRAWADHDCAILIKWEPLRGESFNPQYAGYRTAPYCTGKPEFGWCLYTRGAGGCWNQRTKEIKAPRSGMEPKRIDGEWYWVEPDIYALADKIPDVRYLGSSEVGVKFDVDGFEDYLPLSSVCIAPGEYEIKDRNGRVLWRMEGAALADWVCASVNGYDGMSRQIAQADAARKERTENP